MTGLTPRQMLEQRAELLAVARLLTEQCEACGIDENDPDDPMAVIVRAARAAIANTETTVHIDPVTKRYRACGDLVLDLRWDGRRFVGYRDTESGLVLDSWDITGRNLHPNGDPFGMKTLALVEDAS